MKSNILKIVLFSFLLFNYTYASINWLDLAKTKEEQNKKLQEISKSAITNLSGQENMTVDINNTIKDLNLVNFSNYFQKKDIKLQKEIDELKKLVNKLKNKLKNKRNKKYNSYNLIVYTNKVISKFNKLKKCECNTPLPPPEKEKEEKPFEGRVKHGSKYCPYYHTDINGNYICERKMKTYFPEYEKIVCTNYTFEKVCYKIKK